MLIIGTACDRCGKALRGRQRAVCSNACRQALKRNAKLTNAERIGRLCDVCGNCADYANGRGAWCEVHTARSRYLEAEAARWDVVCALEGCGNNAGWEGEGRARKYCSNAHSQKAYRLRKAAASN
ncbi:hypothetical protein [Kitasatospora sp. NPDC088548]|uniref:hypothetical protein n=1 Tax=Kitasatospora sp. NPDC088548 TaxID=3364075 RepID=UPI00382091F7